MIGFSSLAVLGAALVQVALAAPAVLETRAGVTTVSASTISSLTPYAQFSRAAYCASSKIISGSTKWACGAACNALPGFVPYITGGNNQDVPLFFVGYWPAQNTAVVVHEGTDPLQLEALLTDIEVLQVQPSQTLFPGLPSSIYIHDGFVKAQAAGAAQVLAAVKKVFADHAISKVTLVGHSLGGAVSTVELAYLRLNLPSTTTFKLVVHGSPRVGNQAFADYIDANFKDVTRVTNAEDLIPIVPGRFLGYHHISGEVHIQDSGAWLACAGQDNTDSACTTGDVGNIFEGNIIDHLGPYNGVFIGTIFCT